MSVRLIWRKKLNHCNTSNELNVTSPTPMSKPLTPHHEPSQEKNHPNQALPNPYIKDTRTSPQVVLHPLFPISPINLHVTHTQAPLQSENQTQNIPPLSPSRESLVDDINQLQDLSNLLAMHLSQQQNNIPSSPYSLNLPHTLSINQVEIHVLGTCGELDAFVLIPDEGDMAFLRKMVKSGAAVGKLVFLQVSANLGVFFSYSVSRLIIYLR
nr:hypothetical protein [Tanacetum cinerariifolium]